MYCVTFYPSKPSDAFQAEDILKEITKTATLGLKDDGSTLDVLAVSLASLVSRLEVIAEDQRKN